MRFSDDGVHLTDTDLVALVSQHDAELGRYASMVIRVLKATPDELERMRREYSAHVLAAGVERQQAAAPPTADPPWPIAGPSPPTAGGDTTLTISRAQLAELIKDELHRNNAHWEQIANRLLYSDQATLERIRAAHEREKAARSTPPPA